MPHSRHFYSDPMNHSLTPFRSLFFIGAALLGGAACAQAPAAKTQPLWEYGLTGFVGSGPAYVGSATRLNNALVLPWFTYRGDVIRADNTTVGARVFKTDAVDLDVGFGLALGASSKDVPLRAGMRSLGFQFEFGPRARFNLWQPDPGTRLRLDVPLRAAFEVSGGIQQRGLVFEPKLSWSKRDRSTGFALDTSVSAAFADQRYHQFLYGVAGPDVTATRPLYTAKAGLNTLRLQSTAVKDFSADWRGFGFVRYDSNGQSANKGSPLHVSSGGAGIGIGAIWTIGRSETKGSD